MLQAQLVYKNQDSGNILIRQTFDKPFKTIKGASKFLENQVRGMKAVSLEPDIRIFGIVNEGEKNVYSIALF